MEAVRKLLEDPQPSRANPWMALAAALLMACASVGLAGVMIFGPAF